MPLLQWFAHGPTSVVLVVVSAALLLLSAGVVSAALLLLASLAPLVSDGQPVQGSKRSPLAAHTCTPSGAPPGHAHPRCSPGTQGSLFIVPNEVLSPSLPELHPTSNSAAITCRMSTTRRQGNT